MEKHCKASRENVAKPIKLPPNYHAKIQQNSEDISPEDRVLEKEETAKRQILAEVRQREAVQRISAKYETSGLAFQLPEENENAYIDMSGGALNNVIGRNDVNNKLTYNNETQDCIPSDTDDGLYSLVLNVNNNPVVTDEKTAKTPIHNSNIDDRAGSIVSRLQNSSLSKNAHSGYQSGGYSDAASDISDRTVSSSSSAASNFGANRVASPAPEEVALTDKDIQQVELFYQSHKTEVFVCKCMANLYFGNVTQKHVKNPEWTLYATGIPVLVLDSGLHHRIRRLYFIIAEKGTGFVLWKDILDNLSNYVSSFENFHSLQVSTDHTKFAGISFDDTLAAADFLTAYRRFTCNPNDDLMKLSSQRTVTKRERSKSKHKRPSKTEISQPCCFVHVTTIQRPAVSVLPPPKPKRESTSIDNNPRFSDYHESVLGDIYANSENRMDVVQKDILLNSDYSPIFNYVKSDNENDKTNAVFQYTLDNQTDTLKNDKSPEVSNKNTIISKSPVENVADSETVCRQQSDSTRLVTDL